MYVKLSYNLAIWWQRIFTDKSQVCPTTFFFYSHWLSIFNATPPAPPHTHTRRHTFIHTLSLPSALHCTEPPTDPGTEQCGAKPTSKECFLFILSFLSKLMRGKPSFDKSAFQHISPFSLFLEQSSFPSRPFKCASFHFRAYFLSGYWTQLSRNYKEEKRRKNVVKKKTLSRAKTFWKIRHEGKQKILIMEFWERISFNS